MTDSLNESLLVLYTIWLRERGLTNNDESLRRFMLWLEAEGFIRPTQTSRRAAPQASPIRATTPAARLTPWVPPAKATPSARRSTPPKSSGGHLRKFLVGVVALVAVVVMWPKSGSGLEKFDALEGVMPRHGTTTCELPSGGWAGRSPSLSVIVPSGPETYLVKIADMAGNRVCRIIVEGGNSASVVLPLGTYVLSYGAGTKWYGYSLAFGPEGAYAVAQETFPIEPGTHWEVELVLQRGGNLATSSIDYEDF